MKKISIKDNSKLKRNEDKFLYTEVDGETVLMNIESGAYLGLNSVTSDIWNILEQEISFSALIDSLLSQYEVDPKQCKDETEQVLKGLIQIRAVDMSN